MRGKCRSMTDIRGVIHRLREGQSDRCIERETGIDRSIIRKIRKLSFSNGWLNLSLPMPKDEEIARYWTTTKSSAERNHPLDIHRDSLQQWKKEGLSSVVIRRLLKGKSECSSQSIRRYLKKHFPNQVKPVMVRDTHPGQDMDVDFGYLGIFLDDSGNKRKVWVVSFRLRHSRRAYREIVLDQSIQTFLQSLIHAFEWFGGSSKNIILDNFKAAVIRSTRDNDMINRSFQELAEHYGCVISPCLPRTPEHKGGVEGDINYIKKNFRSHFFAIQKEKNIQIPKISELVEALDRWGREVADLHVVHGVGRSPLSIFKEEEEKALTPLPKERWEQTSWSQCVVRKDWRIMHESAYYAVPYHLIGKTVLVCSTQSLIRIFYEHKEVAFHQKAQKKWEYKRKAEYAPPLQEEVLQCSGDNLISLAEKVGPHTSQFIQAMLSHPSIDKLRPSRLTLKLAKIYSEERLEKACQRAITYKMFSYSNVKQILEKNLDCQPIEKEAQGKIIPLKQFRFARDSADYRNETFDEKFDRINPISRHGHGYMKAWEGSIADQIMDEEMKR
jgi:transposase